MKLAEALIQRAKCQERIAQIKDRLIASAKIQEGDTPPELPTELFAELDQLCAEQERLMQQINRTNTLTEFEAGKSISDALATRDMLKIRQSINRQVARAGVIEQSRYSRSEIRFVSTVEIASLLKQADDMSKWYRDLDIRIQCLNWTTDLVE